MSDRYMKDIRIFPLLIDSVPEFSRAFKRDDSSRLKHQIFSGGGVSAPARLFFIDAKFAEPTDQDVLAGFKSPFDNFQQRFDGLRRLLLVVSDLITNGFDDVGLRKGHGSSFVDELSWRWPAVLVEDQPNRLMGRGFF